jgi:hypothetical protein
MANSVASQSPFEIAGIALNVLYALLIAALIVAIYYAYRWAKKIYDDFTGPNAVIEKQIADMFTSHQSDGTIAPKDIPPKGTDPIDWIFMDHDLSEPI